MSYAVSGSTITMTRGDTFSASVVIHNPDGSEYRPKTGDKVRFAVKKKVSDSNVLLIKNIPISTMKLVIEPNDTKMLEFGKYIYDMQLTTAEGVVDTFITTATLNITEEVD